MKKNNNFINIVLVIINVIGIICLVYLAIPYILHDESILNPDAMLAGPRWDTCGFGLVIGFVPLLIVNILAYLFIELKNKKLKLLYFIPSLICFVIVSHYLISSFTSNNNDTSQEVYAVIRCTLDSKIYNYDIYIDDNEQYSIGMDENDTIPLSIIDYTNYDTILDSLEKYYKENGGYCP